MNRPDYKIPVTQEGTYIRLDDMEVDWQRYAQDMGFYASYLEGTIKSLRNIQDNSSWNIPPTPKGSQ